jgi:hypothetical protein
MATNEANWREMAIVILKFSVQTSPSFLFVPICWGARESTSSSELEKKLGLKQMGEIKLCSGNV